MRLPAPLAALVTPRRFFADSPYGASLPAAVAVVTAVAIVVTLVFAGIGWLMATSLDATVTMDNPDRPPGQFCEVDWESDSMAERCDQPETIERDAGVVLWEHWQELLWMPFVGAYLLWLGLGVLTHVGARVAGGSARWRESFAIVAWAVPAELVQTLVAFGVFTWLFAGDTITASSEAELQAEVEALVAAVPDLTPLAVGIALWQVVIVAAGVHERHDLSLGIAAVVAAVAVGLATLPWL